MIRALLERVVGRLGTEDDASETDDASRFVPSLLDASVRYAHGGSEAAIARETSAIDEEARRLETRREE